MQLAEDVFHCQTREKGDLPMDSMKGGELVTQPKGSKPLKEIAAWN
jgi:hypothetical protein